MPSTRVRAVSATAVAACLLWGQDAATSAPPPPGIPSGLTVLPVDTNSIRLQFSDNSTNETQFRIQSRAGSTGAFQTAKHLPKNTTQTVIGGLQPGQYYQFRVQALNGATASPFSQIRGAYTDKVGAPSFCIPDNDTLCLGPSGRFRFEGTYRASLAGPPVPARVEKVRGDAGLLWFFDAVDNVDLVVNVLNRCSQPSPRYWVFAAGVTDVEVVLAVTDTQSGRTRQYFNPLHVPFPPIQDTSAFATCP
jgi:hypothetical protein